MQAAAERQQALELLRVIRSHVIARGGRVQAVQGR